jgi:hypothetical protein
MMNDFWKKRDEHRDMLSHFLLNQQPLVFLDESVGNVGDGLIREGTQHLLDYASLPREPVSIDLRIPDSMSKTLLVRGCGGFDQHFHAFMPNVVLRAAPLYRRVVILPSSFDPSQAVVHQCLNQPNVFAIARELQSFAALAPFGRRLAVMDCAIFHRRFNSPDATISRSHSAQGMLLVLRGDKGSPLVKRSLQPNPAINDDISSSSISVDRWLDRIAAAEAVVTDRLHVAVAAALLGKKLFIIDPYDNKLSSYLAFAFGDSFAERIEKRNVEWLADKRFAVPL